VRIGLVGVGLLGSAMAERLLSAGHEVVGWDLQADALARLRGLGGVVSEGAVEALSCDHVLLSLPRDRDVAAVVDENQGEMRAGITVVDTTTGDPNRQAEMGRRLSAVGVKYLDATIGGSSRHVREGRAVAMVGGDLEAFESVESVLASFTSRTFHVGPCGNGSRMKLVVNLVLGLNRASLAEGLALASSLGLDLDLALDCLVAGPAWSRAMDDKGRKMIDGDFSPQARLSQHLKDVRLMLAAADERDLELPLTRLHETLLAAVEAAGGGHDDNSSVVRAWGLHPLADVQEPVTGES